MKKIILYLGLSCLCQLILLGFGEIWGYLDPLVKKEVLNGKVWTCFGHSFNASLRRAHLNSCKFSYLLFSHDCLHLNWKDFAILRKCFLQSFFSDIWVEPFNNDELVLLLNFIWLFPWNVHSFFFRQNKK